MYAQTKPKRQCTSAAPEAAAGQAAEGGGAKRSAGGGGGGRAKPRRSDPARQMMRQPVPGQAEALGLANAFFYSPSRRLSACQHQRTSGTHHPILPLSPVEAHPCVTPECNCKMSHQQLVLSVPLHSPSQVPRAAPPPPASSPRLPPPAPRPPPPRPRPPSPPPPHRPLNHPPHPPSRCSRERRTTWRGQSAGRPVRRSMRRAGRPRRRAWLPRWPRPRRGRSRRRALRRAPWPASRRAGKRSGRRARRRRRRVRTPGRVAAAGPVRGGRAPPARRAARALDQASPTCSWPLATSRLTADLRAERPRGFTARL